MKQLSIMNQFVIIKHKTIVRKSFFQQFYQTRWQSWHAAALECLSFCHHRYFLSQFSTVNMFDNSGITLHY